MQYVANMHVPWGTSLQKLIWSWGNCHSWVEVFEGLDWSQRVHVVCYSNQTLFKEGAMAPCQALPASQTYVVKVDLLKFCLTCILATICSHLAAAVFRCSAVREILILKEPIKCSVPSVFLFHFTSWSQKFFCFQFLTHFRGVVSFLTVLNHKGPPL